MTTIAQGIGFASHREALQAGMLASYPEQIRRAHWTRDEIIAHQAVQLQDLLAHAAEHSPFHARRLRRLNLASVGPEDLGALPVMTKAEMMDEFDEVFTRPGVTRALIEDALGRTTVCPQPLNEDVIAFATGGSSGMRGLFALDRAPITQWLASITRGMVERLQSTGTPAGGFEIAILASDSAVHPTGFAEPLTGGGGLGFRYIPVPVSQPVSVIVEQLNELQLPALYGYPSVLVRLAHEQRCGRLRISPMIVTSTSETLFAEQRAAIRDAFGAPVINSFASTEGLVGASLPDDEAIVFAEDGCIVELVDDLHQPVPAGTPSAHVLITNLYNRLQPLIRYQLDDSLIAQPGAQASGHLRALVQGRSDDSFRYADVTIHPFVVRAVLVKSPGVVEYQIHQTPDGLNAKLIGEDPIDVDPLREQLAEALDHAGLPGARVSVEQVSALSRHAQTGKLRRFVPCDA